MRLELQQLAAGYGRKIILDGVSLEAPEGKILTLLGPNGCGKSTLLKTIGRLLRPQGGAVLLDGKSIHRLDTAKLARDLAILPQLHHAPADLTVRQLVSCGRFPHRKGLARRGSMTRRWSNVYSNGPGSPNWPTVRWPRSPAANGSGRGSR